MSERPVAEPFREVTRLEALGEGAFEARIREGWYQGRGAFGGLIVALIVRALEALVGDDGRPLRTLTCHFCAPAVAGAGPFLPVRLVVFPEFAHAAPVYATVSDLLKHLPPQPQNHSPLSPSRTPRRSPWRRPPSRPPARLRPGS